MRNNLLTTYSFYGIIKLILFVIRTKFVFKKARIIRFPFYIRGKKFIQLDKGFTTGYNCRIDAYPFFSKNIIIKIGTNVQINDNVHIGGIKHIHIGNNVLIASKVFITDHNHGNYKGPNQDSPFSNPEERELHAKEVIIRDNVWIGEFVSILPGSVIGESSIIGTMSVVNGHIPPYSIAVGSPAKVIKTYNFDNKQWEKVN